MYQRILVAVDGSASANLALQEALKCAQKGQAQLRLAHVIDVTSSGEGQAVPETVQLATRQKGQEILEAATRQAPQIGIEVETVLLESHGHQFSRAIIEEATRWPAELIVMGTHGRTGLVRLVLGSVAEGVVHLASVPVLLIRSQERAHGETR